MRSLLRTVSVFLAATGLASLARCQYTNPVLYEDLADLDIFRVDDKYYYSASTMHYSPGAPILESYDLVNWRFIGHSVPELSFGSKYYLNTTERGYVNGIWASTMRYRKSNGLWYWYGCIDFAKTYVFTSRDPAAEWEAHPPISECMYDAGLLIDDDDSMYIAYGQGTTKLAKLSSDGLKIERTATIATPGSSIEGARMYKINGQYFVWQTRPANGQIALRADSVWGPYTQKTILNGMKSPIPYSGTPHQGGIVDTPDGNWYYMAFLDAYPAGRIPALAPLRWESNWPVIVTDSSGGWGKTYPSPIRTTKTLTPAGPYKDTFSGTKLGPEWEWNHNPDKSAFTLNNDGLTLRTSRVTTDFYSARNTLTHRILGPQSSGTFRLSVANMSDGDVVGVAIFRDDSAYIGVRKTGSSLELVAVHGIIASQSGGWATTSGGSVKATASLATASAADVWLRVTANVTPSFGRGTNSSLNPTQFSYSTDGSRFTNLGPQFGLHNRWQYFMAFRFAVFNYATKALGGSVLVKEFELVRV